MIDDYEINWIKPSSWIYGILLFLLWLIVRLPQRLRLWIGAQCGRLFFKFANYRRAISIANINLVFNEQTAAQRQQLCDDFFQNIGKGFIETAMAWFLSDASLRKISRLEADENALALLRDDNTAVILVGSHSTLLELGLRLLSLYVPASGLYKPLHHDFFNRWICKQRRKIANNIINFKDMRQTIHLLKNGANIWYALDQDMGARVSIFAPFFNIAAATVNIVPKLKQKTNARLIPVFMWREGNQYVVRIQAEIITNDDELATMTQINEIFEAQIRKYPTQYYWVHRRFKTRPSQEQRRKEIYPSK